MLSNAPVIDPTRAFFDAGIPRTPWFPHDARPAHPGAYEIGTDEDAGAVEWDGEQWLALGTNIPVLMSEPWRGTTSPAYAWRSRLVG